MSRDEGVIKFDCQWVETSPPSSGAVAHLINYRTRLFRLGLIGVYPDGIGFGNISMRAGEHKQFYISASQTGHLAEAWPEHFALVTDYSIVNNWIKCAGARRASSESLTHAMIYRTFPEANAVIHVHNRAAWEQLKDKVPTSRNTVPYGTPEMAKEIERLANESDLAEMRFMVMAGHDEGILSFGSSLDEAYQTLVRHLGK